MFTRRLADDRVLTLEVAPHPDDPSQATILAHINGELVASGTPKDLTHKSLRDLPEGFTHRLGKVALLEYEARELNEELDRLDDFDVWHPEGLGEIDDVLDALERLHARSKTRRDEDLASRTAEIERLTHELEVLGARYPVALLYTVKRTAKVVRGEQ